MASFSIFRQIEKSKKSLSKVLNAFVNIMENGANAPFSIFSHIWYLKDVKRLIME